MIKNILCPIDGVMINNNQARTTAGLVFVSTLAWLLTGGWIIPAILGSDFYLRAFGHGRYSPLNIVSGWLVAKLRLGNKPTDQAPKLFAAQLGFIIVDLLFLAAIFCPGPIAYGIAAPLLVFSFLESALGICVGCHVYSLLKRLA